MRSWLSFSQPGFQLTAGRAEPMFSDEGIYWGLSTEESLAYNYANSKGRQMGFGPNGQEHQREGSHGDLESWALTHYFFHLAMTANYACDKMIVWHVPFMLFIFLNIGLECNCMKLYHSLQLENDFILFCILQVRWHKVTKILT